MADRARKGELRATPTYMPFLHADDAAAAAAVALDWPAGPVNVVDDDPATGYDWLPAFCESVGAPAPRPDDGPAGRPVSNARARALGWTPRYPSWREGFREP